MLFSVNKGRDDLRDSLLMMSEEGNGNGSSTAAKSQGEQKVKIMSI